MNDKVDIRYLLEDTRSRIYLLWAGLCALGFTAAHLSTNELGINVFWVVLSLLGLGYMYKVMPLRVHQAKRIFNAWLWPISVGIVLSFVAFRVDLFADLAAYLGAVWLFVMAVGYLLNGLADPPSGWYWIAVAMNLVSGLLCIFVDGFSASQWLIAAIVSVWSMLNLWLFRT